MEPFVRMAEVERGRGRAPFTARERQIAIALAGAAMPAYGRLPGGGAETAERLERFVVESGELGRAIRAGMRVADLWAIRFAGRPFVALSPADRARVLEAWHDSPSRYERWALRAALTPIKTAHFDDPKMYADVGCRYDLPPVRDEARPWMANVRHGRDAAGDLSLVCEVLVIGTGAGGAAAAYELAKAGRAVLLLEAGEYHGRKDFRGRLSEANRKMYLGRGSTIALGNVAAPIWAGRGVGGSTTINSGTCYRAPDWVLEEWGTALGLAGLSPRDMDAWYTCVESMLGVEPAPKEHLGRVADVIARGAGLMNLSHKPLARNAPGCDGQGVCCFGCPTGAKRSTDVSYVPEALKRGAELVTGAHVYTIDVVDGRARGASGRLASGRAFHVRAEAVVVAGGALLTPALLGRSGLCGGSGWLGRNLSIHPATKVMALMDEHVDMSRGIPQSYTIDAYKRDGLMFEGASTPYDVTALSIPWVGEKFMAAMSEYMKLATFGLMIRDTSRGSVRANGVGLPFIRYDLNAADTRQMQRGIEILSEVFLRAGARTVMPMVHGFGEIRGEEDLAKLRRMELQPGDFEVTAFHPLGTCRMGADPATSCVNPDGEAWDMPGLWVADGSAVPTSLGVNPQMTIMALALRTAGRIDAGIGRPRTAGNGPRTTDGAPRAAVGGPRAPDRGRRPLSLSFSETMSGTSEVLGEKEPFSFSIRARSKGTLRDLARTKELAIEGVVSGPRFGEARPLSGTLVVDLFPGGRLAYAFDFVSKDGEPLHVRGQKRVRLLALRRTMTSLPGVITDAAGNEVALADVAFDMRDLPSFLLSYRIGR